MLEQIRKYHQRHIIAQGLISMLIGLLILQVVANVLEIGISRDYDILYAVSLPFSLLLIFIVLFTKAHPRIVSVSVIGIIVTQTVLILLLSKDGQLTDGVVDAFFVFNAPVMVAGLTAYITSTTVNRLLTAAGEYLSALDTTQAELQQESQMLTEFAGISEIVMAVNRSLHLDDVLTTINTALALVTAMEIVVVQPYDSASACLNPPAITPNFSSELVEALGDDTDKTSILGSVLHSLKPFVNESVQTSTDPVLQDIARLGIYTLLCMPLMAGAEIVGVVTLASRHPKKFRGRSRSALMTATCEIGTAIRNAALYESEQREREFAQALCCISEEVSHSLNRQGVFDTIAHRFKEVIGAEGCSLLLLNETGDVLTVVASAGLLSDKIRGLRFPFGAVPNWHVIDEGKHRIANSAKEVGVPPYIQAILGAPITSMLVVPLRQGEEIIGSVAAFNKLNGSFTEEDARRLKSLASSVSSPIRNVQLFDDLARLVSERTDELRIERDRAEEAVAFKDEMLSMVSHDLRTPLSTIKGCTTTLADYVDQMTPEKQKELLSLVERASDSLDSLISDLLDLSRLEAGRLRVIKDQIVLARTLNQLWHAAEWKTHRLVLNIAPDTPERVPADAEHLLRVLANLVQNAVKYTPHNTTITVSAAREGDNVLIAVEDEGPGIPDEYHEKIFEHFYRGVNTNDGKIHGTGLGLAICKGLVEEHGGCIWVENRPQGGSRFVFTLSLELEEGEGGDEK